MTHVKKFQECIHSIIDSIPRKDPKYGKNASRQRSLELAEPWQGYLPNLQKDPDQAAL